MHFFRLEHGKIAYRADFALYAIASVAMAVFLTVASPRAQHWSIIAFALAGLGGWSLIEYAIHRFILHGLRPFSTWHAEHHHRPTALICTPTIFSALLIVVLVFLPAFLLWGKWHANALTFGVLTGYLAYAVTHHATHHWRVDNQWLRRRRKWHAMHHSKSVSPGHYGVTSSIWDHVFGSHGKRQR
jgi:sterol desaturase/sphingolipid hydroxylase (fatty acid hydroxylase superfamily)